jgi:hypothetical protein
LGAALVEGATMPDDPEILMAADTYIDYPQANVPVRVDKGKTARPGHPIVKRTPQMWVPIVVDYEVERPKAESKRTGGRGNQ